MKKKLNIECDHEGKILSYNDVTKSVFNEKKSLINKRIFNIIQNDFVIDFIKIFNNFILTKKKIVYETSFLKSKNISFYGVVTLIKTNGIVRMSIDEIKEKYPLKNKNKIIDKVNIIIRSKFLIGSLLPLYFSILWSIKKNIELIQWHVIPLIILCIILLHIAANTFNDYFDWKSGRDKLNTDYVLFSTGGSRAIDLNLITERRLIIIPILCFILIGVTGLYLVYIRGFEILIIGLIAVFSVYFYSAPPIHLASRYGLGELMHIICLGPLINYGGVLSLTGNCDINDLIIGFPFGLLITGCLLMNEFPDSKFDKISNKNNLAVVLGTKYVPYLYSFLLILSFLIILYAVISKVLPFCMISIFILLPYGYCTVKNVSNIKLGRSFITKSCLQTFNIYFYFNIILIIIMLLSII